MGDHPLPSPPSASAADPAELSHASYWDARYLRADEHEWLLSAAALQPLLTAHLPPPSSSCRLLHLGCGTSTLPAHLHAQGYTAQLCVDFSAPVVATMRSRTAHLTPPLEYLVLDIRHMDGVGDGTVDVAIDKATLDGLLHGSLWDPPASVRADIGAYLDEVARVLGPKGTFVYVSFRQPHFLRPLLEREGRWRLSVESVAGREGGFEYFGYVMVKGPARTDQVG